MSGVSRVSGRPVRWFSQAAGEASAPISTVPLGACPTAASWSSPPPSSSRRSTDLDESGAPRRPGPQTLGRARFVSVPESARRVRRAPRSTCVRLRERAGRGGLRGPGTVAASTCFVPCPAVMKPCLRRRLRGRPWSVRTDPCDQCRSCATPPGRGSRRGSRCVRGRRSRSAGGCRDAKVDVLRCERSQ